MENSEEKKEAKEVQLPTDQMALSGREPNSETDAVIKGEIPYNIRFKPNSYEVTYGTSARAGLIGISITKDVIAKIIGNHDELYRLSKIEKDHKKKSQMRREMLSRSELFEYRQVINKLDELSALYSQRVYETREKGDTDNTSKQE